MPQVLQGGDLTLRCPVCRQDTLWESLGPERRSGEDRRQSADRPPRPDRRAPTESVFVHLADDGNVASGPDQRNFPRYFEIPQAYVLMVEGSGGLKDLSLGGAFIEDREPLAVGEEVRLELRLGNYKIPVTAIVRRSIWGQGMGVEFIEMPAEGKRRLKVYLSSLAAPEYLKKESS